MPKNPPEPPKDDMPRDVRKEEIKKAMEDAKKGKSTTIKIPPKPKK